MHNDHKLKINLSLIDTKDSIPERIFKKIKPLVWAWDKIKLPQVDGPSPGHVFEEHDEMLKEKYPIRYFLLDQVPFKISMFWKWRIAENWYRLKCRVWHRYNTVEATTLDRTYSDVSELMLHINFQMLVTYVEKEEPFEHIDWEDTRAMSSVAKEIRELYQWWTVDRGVRDEAIWDGYDDLEEISLGRLFHPDEDIQNSPDVLENRAFLRKCSEEEEAANLEDNLQLIRLVKIRQYLWV